MNANIKSTAVEVQKDILKTEAKYQKDYCYGDVLEKLEITPKETQQAKHFGERTWNRASYLVILQIPADV